MKFAKFHVRAVSYAVALDMEHVALCTRLFCHRSVDYCPFMWTESRRTKFAQWFKR